MYCQSVMIEVGKNSRSGLARGHVLYFGCLSNRCGAGFINCFIYLI